MENKDIIGKREVFCRFIRKGGKIIYPKNARFFHFWVDDIPTDNSNKAKQPPVLDDEQVK